MLEYGMTYQAELAADAARTLFYGNTTFDAPSDMEAIVKAKDWARASEHFREDAWLFVVCGPRGVKTLKPGEF